MLTPATVLDEIYNSAYALASCPSSSKRTRSTGSGDLDGLVSGLHYQAHVLEKLTFAMDMPRLDMPVEPLLPRECCERISDTMRR